ncbi:uncharacterized protein LOC126198743 [Schistocerca nitens]|uniref:uncharacterized protein LOC126198743 n=1 Tax=Schistocerca nitens TaxID=7011 RepID=UPI002118500A|nr:uncharacterized protein LOC126198743 [Schistocerca nitens]
MKPRRGWSQTTAMLATVMVLMTFSCADGAISVDVTCTQQICEEQLTETECPKVAEECRNGSGVFMPYPDVCNCCEYCFTYLKEGEICTVGMPGRPLPTAICGPGLSCYSADTTDEDAEPVCRAMNTTCTRDQKAYDSDEASASLGIAAWRPRCDGDGFYAPAHCVPNGVCYCVEKYSRGRIFGEKIFTSTLRMMAMSCGCSRMAWTAEQLLSSEQLQRAGSARCREDGSYDPLQCVAGTCYCVNTTTGQPLTDSGTVNVNNLVAGSLPCFDKDRHREGRWETDCERERRLAFLEVSQLAAEGVLAVGVVPPLCDPDGTYSRVQARASRKICVDTQGNQIGNYSISMSSELAVNMDCNCARTRLLLEAEGRQDGLPRCCISGDFVAWQCWRGRCYCVDRHGAQSSSDVPASELTSLPCWADDNKNVCASDDGVYSQQDEGTTETSTEQSATGSPAAT